MIHDDVSTSIGHCLRWGAVVGGFSSEEQEPISSGGTAIVAVVAIAEMAHCLCHHRDRLLASLAFLSIFSAVAAAVGQTSESGMVRIDPDSGHYMVDGRVAIFRGVNVVYKVHPWIPRLDGVWSPFDSLVEQDYDFLQDIGVTVVRLGSMWPGVEIGSYIYNSSYLDALEQIVNALGKRGIFTILDAHQDIFSRKTCGEGAFEAVVSWKEGLPGYPMPVLNHSFPVNASTGLISLQDCLSINFFSGYWSYTVSNAFQNFYDNVNGAADHFAASWQQVARRFAKNPFVLGYEVLNEPWPGDIHEDPKLEEISGYGDVTNLLPLYEKVHSAIRAVDPEHIMLYECAVHGSDFGTGFEMLPGGMAERDRIAYSYHVYCSNSDSHLDPKNLFECMVEWDHSFWTRLVGDARHRIQNAGAGFLTEFGANDNRTIGVDGDNYVLDRADDFIQSAIYWQYKYFNDLTTSGDASESLFNKDGSLQLDKVKALARTYAHRVAGRPTHHRFRPENGYFELSYEVDCKSPAAPTETVVFFHEQLWYPRGYDYLLYPSQPGLVAVQHAGKNTLHLVVLDAKALCAGTPMQPPSITFVLMPK